MRAYFTPRAEIDLEEIGDYIALDNPKRALTFIQEIRQHCERIGDRPMGYVARPDLGDTISICAHGNYLIVFDPTRTVPLSCACFMVPGISLQFSAAHDLSRAYLMVELRGEDRDEELEARVLGQGGFLLVRCVRRDPQAAGRDRVGPAPALACRSFPTAASDTSATP